MSTDNTQQIILPEDSAYDDARQAWNLSVDLRPDAVVLARSVEDVVAAVKYASEQDLQVAVQATGHGAPARGPLAGTLLLNMRELRGVTIDAENRRAKVQAGAVWDDVVTPAGEHGLAALHGSSPNVGVVGYSLGGGIGWMARTHGLAADSILAAEIVTADGELIRADRTENPDVFWAIRGGGAGLGVIVSLELALYPVSELVAGMLVWPWERSAEVFTRYVEWAESAPDCVTTSCRMLQIPPLPDIPEVFRGRQLVVIDGAVIGTEDEASDILAPLRELEPEIDTFAMVPAASLVRLHMDPEPPMPAIGDGEMLTALDADAVGALLAAAGPGTDSPMLVVELRQLGGALGERRPGAGALGALDGSFVFMAQGVAAAPGMAEAIEARLDTLKDALAPWSAEKTYLNFAERRVSIGDAIGAEAFSRLEQIRAEIDPGGLFQSGHAFEAPGQAASAA